MEKPAITVTIKASGQNRDGVRFNALIEGPAETYENMIRKMEDAFYRNDIKPMEEEQKEAK